MVLLLHFACIISISVRKEISSKWDYWVRVYTDPFMHQDWKLFVPPPSCNYSLYIINREGSHDVFREVLDEHRSALLSGNGHKVISFANLIHFFEKNAALQQSGTAAVEEDPYFNMLLYAIAAHEKQKHGSSEGKIILVADDIENKSRRIFFGD